VFVVTPGPSGAMTRHAAARRYLGWRSASRAGRPRPLAAMTPRCAASGSSASITDRLSCNRQSSSAGRFRRRWRQRHDELHGWHIPRRHPRHRRNRGRNLLPETLAALFGQPPEGSGKTDGTGAGESSDPEPTIRLTEHERELQRRYVRTSRFGVAPMCRRRGTVAQQSETARRLPERAPYSRSPAAPRGLSGGGGQATGPGPAARSPPCRRTCQRFASWPSHAPSSSRPGDRSAVCPTGSNCRWCPRSRPRRSP
jgi:hypothetical protein